MIPDSPPLVDQQRGWPRGARPIGAPGRPGSRWCLTWRLALGRVAALRADKRMGGARTCTLRARCGPGPAVASLAEGAAGAPAGNRAAAGPLLEIRDIALRFGGIVALDGVSFTIETGPDPRSDRPERRRQDDPVQLRQPALHPESRRHPVRGPLAARPAAAPHRRDRHRPHLPEPGAVRPAYRCSTTSASAPTRTAAAISSPTRCASLGAAAGGGGDRDRLVLDPHARTRRGGVAAGRRAAASAPASGSSWRARWPVARSCCCSTSRRAG